MEGRGMRCEAMVMVASESRPSGMFVPCGLEDADLHHKITRARGGLLLDAAGETYHHLYLCRPHHNVAHDEGQAVERGLVIKAAVTARVHGQSLYPRPD